MRSFQIFLGRKTAAVTPPAGGRLKVWSGTAWVEKPAKVWSGSAWVAKPVKFWNGTAWVGGGVAGPSGPTASLVTAFTPGGGRNDYTGEVGWRAGIGPTNVPFSWIGIQYSGGNRTPRRVFVYEWFSNTTIAQADIDVSSVALGDWAWASVTPATMLANGYYAIVLKVTNGDGQTWTNPGPTTVKPTIVNVYSIYRDTITVPGFANGVIDTQYVGLDLGW
jgi:hypothetical protein